MNDTKIEEKIIPVNLMTGRDYTPGDSSNVSLFPDWNELFVFPYNINTIFNNDKVNNPDTDTSELHNLYSIGRSDILAYSKMQIYDATVALFFEYYNDIFGWGGKRRISIINMFMEMLDKSKVTECLDTIVLGDAHTTMSIIFSNIVALFSEFISKMTLDLIAKDDHTVLMDFYESNVVINEDTAYEPLSISMGNRFYMVMSSLFRDHLEVKLVSFRRQFQLIADTIENMKKYSVENQHKEILNGNNNPYYEYLTTEKYKMEV